MFLLLRSCVICLRGHRSSESHPVANVDLAYSEGHLDAGALK